MFCDIVGSTAMSSQLDPEDLRGVITKYQKACQQVVSRFEGHIAQYMGDGLLVYFGYPVAHENDAHRAVSSGIGILKTIEQLNQSLEETHSIVLSVRIGVHTGLVVVGDIGAAGDSQRLALGATPNIAARLEGVAAPDTVVISEATYGIVSQYFNCEDLGKHTLKGIPSPLMVYQVINDNTAKSRSETANPEDGLLLVGRDGEVKALLNYWKDAKKGKSRVVMISGEAGIGKSRILHAVLSEVVDEPNCWLMPHNCSPYHRQTAFYPFSQSIKEMALRLTDDETPETQLSKLEKFLRQYEISLQDVIPLFAGLLNIPLVGSSYRTTAFSIEQQKRKIIDTFISIILKRAKEQNLLLIFEDLHWMDSSSLEVIGQIIKLSPENNILSILSFRPDFTPHWKMQPHLVSIVLPTLPDTAARAIIQKIGKRKELPAELVDQIITKTDGIPLFVEELTKMVLGSDMVVENESNFQLTRPISSLAIPTTLHDSLVARLDRSSGGKRLAQIGAVIGRNFEYSLIKLASRLDEVQLRGDLDQLVQAELLQQTGIPPNAAFTFRHALIRDAAYQSLLKSKQRQIHQQIGNILLDHYPEIVAKSPETVAYHLEKGKQIPDAIVYWTKAGEILRRRQAFEEALVYLDRSLSLIKQVQSDREANALELKVLAIQAPIYLMTAGWGSALTFQASSRMKSLAEDAGDKINLFHALRITIICELFGGQPNQALKFAKECLAIALELDNNEFLMDAYRILGQTSIFVGQFQNSLKAFKSSIALYRSSDNQAAFNEITDGNPGILSLIQSCNTLWQLGYPDQALERMVTALALARENKHPYQISFCLFICAIISAWCGRTSTCLSYSTECYQISTDYGNLFFANEAKSYMGYAQACSGRVKEGVINIEEAINHRMHTTFQGSHIHVYTLATVHLLQENFESGLEVIEKSLTLTGQTGDQCFLSEMHRIKGELLHGLNAQANAKEIEDCFSKSAQLSRKHQTKSLELRTMMSMAKWLQSQGQTEKGLASVSKVYAWFTEGFTTRDLLDAKALINEMSANPSND
ncbi:MAG: adenylate/guanylate cyclase domain-containing protein [Cyclobacteriaceae bacterium]|nr:MAG: adenylate/guanylate cyclase domain-containing protein [Cyclobacteriaceae bacterium]